MRATSLYEKVYEHLKREVYEGRFPRTEPVLETDLAVRLGVSRTPVREALRMLATEGLLVPQQGGGHVAMHVGERDMHDAVEARVAIETLAVRFAAERADAACWDELDAINRRARTALEAGLIGETMEANQAFHHALAAATGSRLIEFLLARIYEYLLVSRVLDGVKAQRQAFQEMRRFVSEHEEIAAAIRAGDADGAAALMARHLGQLAGWYESSLALAQSTDADPKAPAAEVA